MSTEHRKFMSWTFQKTDRMYSEIDTYGDKIYQLGIFDFTVDSTGIITRNKGMSSSDNIYHLNRINSLIAKYPNIKWYLTVRNDGISSIFAALYNNTNRSQTTFISEINRILDENPYAAGVDIDLEQGGGVANRDKIIALFGRISSTVRGRGLKVHFDLPPMTAPYTTVGSEQWCAYEDLKPLMDSCTIMSYGMAWAGSAPGPVSPLDWLEKIYNYAVSVLDPGTVFMGIPAYGYRWQIHAKPQELGQPYRGTSLTYLGAQNWLLGNLNHTGDGPPQPLIPFAGFWDEKNQCPWAYLHVYDYLEGHDHDDIIYPLQEGSWGGKNFVACYAKQEQYEFGSVILERSARDYNEINGAMGVDDSGYLYPRQPALIENPDGTRELEPEGYAKYVLDKALAGTLVVEVNFPWFDRNWLVIKVDGRAYEIGPDNVVPARYGAQGSRAQWYPLNRVRHWRYVCEIAYTGSEHVIEVIGSGSRYYTQFWGFRVLGRPLQQEFSGGSANYTAKLCHFKNKNGADAYPGDFKASLEVLRRPPDSALIWYEDWRDYDHVPGYYNKTGTWQVITDPGDRSSRPYRWVRGSGTIYLDYSGFENLHLKGRFCFLKDISGRAGVAFKPGNGDELWAALNYTNQRVELWQGSTLLVSTSLAINPGWQYTVELRCRGTEAKVWVTGAALLTVTITAGLSGAPGIKSDCTIENDLFRVGDAYWYQPQEAARLYFGGQSQSLGRIPRSGVTWDDYWGYFYLDSGEERETRVEAISNDWDYLHTSAVTLPEGEHEVLVELLDSGVWLSNIYVGDADGFSVMYYSDMNNYFYLANLAKHKWKLKGVGLWALGMEDQRLLEYLPKEEEHE